MKTSRVSSHRQERTRPAGPARSRSQTAPESRSSPLRQWEREAEAAGAGFRSGQRGTASRPADAFTNASPVHDPPTSDGGHPLPPPFADYFGSRIGHDFSDVRIHADASARELADQANANAVAWGRDIFLADASASPRDLASQPDLMGHELTHVAQQSSAGEAFAQTQPRRENLGIGRTPPEEPYTEAEGLAPEDGFVLFKKDSADLDLMDPDQLLTRFSSHPGPVRVEVHGYASLEGDRDYNRNLSAHRAVALRRYLLEHLPPNSEVIAFAHGETFGFGKEFNANRRVGFQVTDLPATDTSRTGPQESTEGEGPTQTGLPGVNEEVLRRIIERSVIETEPSLPPIAPPLSGFRPNYFDLMSPGWLHLEQPTLRDFDAVMDLAQRNYRFFEGILGRSGRLPLLGDANDLANLTASFAYGTQLGLENPTYIERENREWENAMRAADPSFFQTPILSKTWYWSFPWERVPSGESRKRKSE